MHLFGMQHVLSSTEEVAVNSKKEKFFFACASVMIYQFERGSDKRVLRALK